MTLVLFLALAALPGAGIAGEPVATADQLKSKALQALRAGKFELTQDYLTQAAELSKDPIVGQMAKWAQQFGAQRQKLLDERRAEYEKAAKEAQLLRDKDLLPYALEYTTRAYLLRDDKDAFRKEGWVSQLLEQSKKLATDYEKKEQWIKSLRIYSQLTTIEPDAPEWKEHLKTSTRRVRLLALYTPEELRKIQDAEAKDREKVDALIHPATQPATKPAEVGEDDPDNAMKWQEVLAGVRMDMLRDALLNAHQHYYRSVTYAQVIQGGLEGLRVVITTPALQREFPGLADNAKRNEFLGVIDAALAQAQQAKERDQEDALIKLLADLDTHNKATVKLPEEVLVYEFADGAFGAMDPFSSIIWPTDWEEFQKTTKGEFSGVGIQIQMDEAGALKVVSPLEDSPAYRAGIKPDSIITHINGKSARGITINQAVKKITGPQNTQVTLTIKAPDGKSKDHVLTRETIKVASVKGWLHLPGGGWEYLIDPDQKIGYVRVTNFTRTTTQDLTEAISAMEKKGARGLIIDLRFNPGGLLNEATQVVDKFVAKGLIVSTKPDRSDSPYPENSMSTQLPASEKVQMPLVVLVNQYSASASEIVSGALKDHERAVIVGERTFGKGSVQMLYPLGRRNPFAGPESVLKLTTSHYYLPKGKCIHREENSKEWGVEPDVTIEMTPEQMRAAIDARQKLDILLDPEANKAGNGNGNGNASVKSPLDADPQLAAALLVMRLQLSAM